MKKKNHYQKTFTQINLQKRNKDIELKVLTKQKVPFFIKEFSICKDIQFKNIFELHFFRKGSGKIISFF